MLPFRERTKVVIPLRMPGVSAALQPLAPLASPFRIKNDLGETKVQSRADPSELKVVTFIRTMPKIVIPLESGKWKGQAGADWISIRSRVELSPVAASLFRTSNKRTVR